jgi:hypothetical protein
MDRKALIVDRWSGPSSPVAGSLDLALHCLFRASGAVSECRWSGGKISTNGRTKYSMETSRGLGHTSWDFTPFSASLFRNSGQSSDLTYPTP